MMGLVRVERKIKGTNIRGEIRGWRIKNMLLQLSHFHQESRQAVPM